jgi:hypothetical protein
VLTPDSGEYDVTLVGDLAAFMVAGDAGVAVGRRAKSMNSGGKIGLLSSLDAGTRNQLDLLLNA